MLRISVKAKQGNEWPSITELHRIDDFLILVDLKGKSRTDPPDFYVLDLEDWKHLLGEERKRYPTATVDKQNRIT